MEAQWLVHWIHKQKVGVHIPVVPKFFSNKNFYFFPFQPLSDHTDKVIETSTGFSVLDCAFREFHPFSVEAEKSGL